MLRAQTISGDPEFPASSAPETRRRIDIHSHLLPGIDDGAETLEEAVAMCHTAADDGFDVMFATPHQRHPHWWNGDGQHLQDLTRQLQEAVGDRLRILSGAEIRVDDGLLEDLERWPDSGIRPLGDSRYLLIEFARTGLGPRPESIVHELKVAGWWPILAHPELLPWLAEDLPRLHHLVSLGAALQLTAMSVVGSFGRRPMQAAEAMLNAGLGHFLASDCHGSQQRPPGVQAAVYRIHDRWGPELARALTEDNPRCVVENRPLGSIS